MAWTFLDRLSAWKDATREPERTSTFLKNNNGDIPDNLPNTNPPNAPKDTNVNNEKPLETPKEDTIEETSVDNGDDSAGGTLGPHDGCGCPVSAALHSIQEEAEAADLYNKRANKVDDPHAREVYRDIAKEEMVHLGEAAQLLAEADPELASEVPKGMEEASGSGSGFKRPKRE